MNRNQKIEQAIAAAGELIGKLLELGPVNAEQAGLIVAGNVRAFVPDVARIEIIERAEAVAADLGKLESIPPVRVRRRKIVTLRKKETDGV
jgi:hypothetical protein